MNMQLVVSSQVATKKVKEEDVGVKLVQKNMKLDSLGCLRWCPSAWLPGLVDWWFIAWLVEAVSQQHGQRTAATCLSVASRTQ